MVFSKHHAAITALFLLLMILLCTGYAGTMQSYISSAVTRCLTIIVPSLYAMMILSQLLIHTGVWRILGKPFRWIAPRLFGMPDCCFALFLCSQFAGYPVGAGMLQELAEQGALSRKDAGRLSLVCFGGGPAFLLGILGNYPNRFSVFLLLFFCCCLANGLLAIVLFRIHPISITEPKQKFQPADAALWIHCTASAGKNLLQLCAMILCFSGICGILDGMHVLEWTASWKLPDSSAIVQSFLEISNVIQLSLPFSLFLPMLCGLYSFGGCCVLLQVRAANKYVSLVSLFGVRLLSAVFSAAFCKMGITVLHWEEKYDFAVTVSGYVLRETPNSIFPACMLLIMTLLVFHLHHEQCAHDRANRSVISKDGKTK